MPDLTAVFSLNISTSSGTYAHANGTTEDDAVVIINNVNNTEIIMDFSLFTQDTTVRTYEKIDGAVYIKTSEAVYPTDFDSNSVVFVLNGKGSDQKITFQSGIAEGAVRDSDFRRVDTERID